MSIRQPRRSVVVVAELLLAPSLYCIVFNRVIASSNLFFSLATSPHPFNLDLS